MIENNLPKIDIEDSENLEDYYYLELDLNGHKIQVDINFESQLIDSELLHVAFNFIQNIEKYDKQNKLFILDDFDDEGDVVKTYLEHHLNVLDKNILAELIEFDNSSIEPAIQLLNKVHLLGLSIYPNDDDNFAVFDYSIGSDLTDYIIEVNTDKQGRLDFLALES